MYKRLITILAALLFFAPALKGQSFAVKTNLIGDATCSFNLGVEAALHSRWTLDVSGSYNPWTFENNRKWKHWLVQPEARFWFCEKMDGHFFALHVHAGAYNVGNIPNNINILGTDFSQLSAYRFEGWFVGAGLGYGYAWILSEHWNLEAEIGVGYAYTRYDRFECFECSRKNMSDVPHHYLGVTKLALNLVCVF